MYVDSVKSNAIVLASNETTVGIGSGQPSRLDSCQIAINKMKKFNLSEVMKFSCSLRCIFSVCGRY